MSYRGSRANGSRSYGGSGIYDADAAAYGGYDRKTRQRICQVSFATIVFLYCFGPSLFPKVKKLLKSQNFGDFVPSVRDGQFMGRYPNSLLTLFYPYTLLRDIVLDQPIAESDVPFFWYVHKSDYEIGKKVLTDCYGLTLVELKDYDSIEKARRMNIVSSLSRQHVVVSPHIREVCEIFTMDNFGRMFAFFRHPLDYELVPEMPTFPDKDNYLTRLLSDVHEGPIEFKQLGIAKKVVYVTTLVGKIDRMVDSIIRWGQYWGWQFVPGKSESCVVEIVDKYNPEETYIDHESEEWKEFYAKNPLDCQLFEQSDASWRGQIQTAIPYETQLKRAEPSEDEEDDEEGEEEEE